MTNPHTRTAPLKKERLSKLGQAVMKARAPLYKDDNEEDEACNTLGYGDCVFALDASKAGNHSKLTNWIGGKGSKLVKKKLSISMSTTPLRRGSSGSKGLEPLTCQKLCCCVHICHCRSLSSGSRACLGHQRISNGPGQGG